MDSKEVAAPRTFIVAINRADAFQLSGAMAQDHTFIDSAGGAESGRDKMTQG